MTKEADILFFSLFPTINKICQCSLLPDKLFLFTRKQSLSSHIYDEKYIHAKQTFFCLAENKSLYSQKEYTQ